MMETDPCTLHTRSTQQGGNYDSLVVVGAWSIVNQARKLQFEAARSRVRLGPVQGRGPSPLSERHAAASSQLPGPDLDRGVGETRLLHGTKPQHLHCILYEGLDPEKAANGLFGRGTYFAEDAGKIDQYAAVDVRFEKEGELAELHRKLYKGVKHPKNVHYALITRVLLGASVHTQDGRTQLLGGASSSSSLFASAEKSVLATHAELAEKPDSLIAEVGEVAQHFREVVVFNSDRFAILKLT